MSKKNLLNEATIRRFMKLSGQEALTSPFVGRLSEMGAYGGNKGDESRSRRDYMEEDAEYGGNKGDESRSRRDYMQEDAEEERELHATEDELGDEDRLAGEEGEELDAMEDEPVGEEAALEPDVRARVEDALAGALEALAGELGDTLGVELDVETAPEEEEMEVDVDAEVELEPTDGDEEAEFEVSAEEEELLEGVQVVDDSALISEVAKRVTARLVRAMAKK